MYFKTKAFTVFLFISSAFGLSNTVWAQEKTKDSPASGDTRLVDQIIVTGIAGGASEVGGSADVLDTKKLETFNYVDVQRLLRAVPGVNIQEEDGYGLRPNIGLRGTGLSRSAKITLMEDGVLIAPAPYASPSAYYFPRVARMSGVEVVKGAAGIIYGPRTQGGSINLLSTPIPENRRFYAHIQGGSDDTVRGHVYAGQQWVLESGVRIGALLETYQDSTHGFKKLDGGGSTGYSFHDYVAKLFIASPDTARFQHSLLLKAQYSDEKSHETYLGLTQKDFDARPYRRYRASARDLMDSEHHEFSAHYGLNINNMKFGFIAYQTKFQRDWYKLAKVKNGGKNVSIGSILKSPAKYADAYAILVGGPDLVSADNALSIKHNNREYKAEGVQFSFEWEGKTHHIEHQITAGARFHKDEMDRFQWADGYRMDHGILVLTKKGVPGTDSNRLDKARAAAFYLQDRLTWNRLTLVPGVRYERVELKRLDYGKKDTERTGQKLKITKTTSDVIAPGLSLLYQATRSLRLFGGVHRGFSPPAPGKKDGKAEKAINWEAGLRWQGPGSSRLDITGFYSDFSNLVGTCTNATGGGCTIGDQFNGGKVDVHGVELSAKTDLADFFSTSLSFPLSAVYTYTNAEFRSSFKSAYGPWGSVTKGDQLPYIPEHQFYISAGLEAPRWRAVLGISYVGERRSKSGHGSIPADEKIEAHTVVDLSADYKLFDQAKLTLRVNNLFDKKYLAARRPAGLRPGAPRSVLVGMKFNF